jgi:hypothetical protein
LAGRAQGNSDIITYLYNIEYLLTFNFKHLVKIKKIDSFNGVNLLNGYGSLNFVNLEMFIPEEA